MTAAATYREPCSSGLGRRERYRRGIVSRPHSVAPGFPPSGDTAVHRADLLPRFRHWISLRRNWAGRDCCSGWREREREAVHWDSKVRWGRRRSGVWLDWVGMKGMWVRRATRTFHTGSGLTSRFHRQTQATWHPNRHSYQGGQ